MGSSNCRRTGRAHQIKYVFESAAVNRAIAGNATISSSTQMLQATDNLVGAYASRSYTYYVSDLRTDNGGTPKCVTPWAGAGENLNSKYGGTEFNEYNEAAQYGAVKSITADGCASCGGATSTMKQTYFYMNLNGGTSTDPNRVIAITVEDTQDGASPAVARYRRVLGLNFRGSPIREALIENPLASSLKTWAQSSKLDSSLRVVEKRMPSAHAGLVASNANVAKFLNPGTGTNDSSTVSGSAGVVEYYEYSTSFGDGKHLTGTLVRQGAGIGSRYYVSATDWGKGTNDQPVDVKLAEYVYPKQTVNRADSSRITRAAYAYTFWDAADTSVKQITTTLPVVATTENGSGTATLTYQYFDQEGRLRWTKDGEGYVDYYSYHPNLGGQAIVINDVNTLSLGGDITGNGGGKWVAWTGGTVLFRTNGLPTALQLTTKQEYDSQGRVVKTIGTGGEQHYVRYEDNKTLQFSFWTGATAMLPVQVTETNEEGQPTTSYEVKPSKSQWDAASGLPKLASTVLADYTSRTVYNYDSVNGRLTSMDSYFDADSGSGYYRTSYLYDALGRRGATVQQVASNRFQVTAQLFDVLARTVETRSGVATSVPTSYAALAAASPGTPTGFLGYATTGKTVYDGGGVGDGRATSNKSYYGTGVNDFIDSIPSYTFVGHVRGVLQKNGTTAFGPYRVQDIDWMGRTTASATYATAPASWPTDYSDYVANSSGASIGQPKTAGSYNTTVQKYDVLGRVFETLSYPGSETVKRIKSSRYYDRRDNLVASEVAGGTATEMAYDGVGRNYQSRTVLTLNTTKYTSGRFSYRNPQPNPKYGAEQENQMSGGDAGVITLNHSVFNLSGTVRESHQLVAHHDDTDGIDLSADDDYVRSSTYQWYDAANRVVKMANHGSGNGGGTGAGTWQYNPLPAILTEPAASSAGILLTLYGYHADSGRQDLVTDPAGRKTKTFFDDLGRTTFVADNFVNFSPTNIAGTIGGGTNNTDDQVVGFSYDGQSNQTALTAYNASPSTADQVTQYKREDVYNASLTTMEVYPDGNTSTNNIRMAYHLDGALNTRTDQRGVVLTYSYDNARRTTLQAVTTLPSGVDGFVRSIGHAYDTLGRVDTVTSYSGTTTATTVRNQIKTSYGTHGQVITSRQDHSGAVGGSEPAVQYAYDESAVSNIYDDGLRLERLTYPNGRVVFSGYDNATQGTVRDRFDRVAELRDTSSTGTQLARYEYMGDGQNAVTTYAQPNIHSHADRDNNGSYELWDRFGRVIQTSWRPTTGTGANHVDLIDYGRDYVGNITYRNVRVDQIAGATTDVNDFDYTYDPLDRLIDSDMGVADNATGQVTTPVGPQETWTLDQLGNWSAYSGVFGSHTRSHNTVNEITAYSGITATPAYDAAGNMTTMNKPETTSTTYTARYDAWNRLVDINTGTVASYQYDGLNRRIKRVEGSTTTFFYYTEKWQCIEERTTETGPAKKQFVWGPNYIDELVLRDRDLDGSTGNGLEERLYALHDQQYNIITVLTPAAVIRERNTYLPYGNVQPATANFTNLSGTASAYDWQHRHTGVRRDVATQLQLHRNRYYHFQMGRWISRDPIGYEGSPWNLYEYIEGRPATGMDPMGLTLKTKCEDRCAKLYPRWWQYHLFVGCIVGCDPGPVVEEGIDNVDKVVCITLVVFDVVTIPSGEGAAGCAGVKVVSRKIKQCLKASAKKSKDVLTCEFLHRKYTNAKFAAGGCTSTNDCTTATAKSASKATEVALRRSYLGKRCDYILPGSIAAGSARKERTHRQELLNATARLARCSAHAAEVCQCCN